MFGRFIRSFILVQLSLLTSACAYFTSIEAPPTDDLRGQNIQISYFDSNVFESTFRHMLASNADSITVSVSNSFGVNDLPEVFQTWISECASRGGEVKLVELKEVPKTRGIGEDIAKHVFNYLYDEYKERQRTQWYNPIASYNIEIVHDESNGAVRELIFNNKNF